MTIAEYIATKTTSQPWGTLKLKSHDKGTPPKNEKCDICGKVPGEGDTWTVLYFADDYHPQDRETQWICTDHKWRDQ